MDNELFELCKEVYVKTLWSDTDYYFTTSKENDLDRYLQHKSEAKPSQFHDNIPLYTSDYLLEKLMNKEPWVGMTFTDGWIAHTKNWNVRQGGQYIDRCNSALEALLKLTLALHEAGELK